MRITTVEQLRDIVGEPTEIAVKKVKPALEQIHAEWLAATPMVFVATADADGAIDVSPKGDPPGKVVHVIDAHTIAIPERPGNRRVDGFRNVLDNPQVGTISVVPGRGDTLRINGVARIVDDGGYFDDLAVRGRRPVLALEIDIREVFFHCAKAFLRSDLWQPDTWNPDVLPTVAQITKRLIPELDQAMLEARYAESAYRKLLY